MDTFSYRSRRDLIQFHTAVSAEDLPCSGTKPRKKCLPLLRTDRCIRIDRSHQDRRITVILCLLRGHVLQIDKDVTGEFDMRFFRPAHCEVNTEKPPSSLCRRRFSVLFIDSAVFVSEVSDRLR